MESVTARRTKVIVTLGPSILEETTLERFKAKGVDFVRSNMSHSDLDELQRAITLAKRVGIPFIIDTEGSQVRTGTLRHDVGYFHENETVRVSATPISNGLQTLSIRPESILPQLEEGDLLHIDFDTLVLRVSDTSTLAEGYVTTKAVTSGFVGQNKAVVVDPVMERRFDLPTLSAKDYESIAIGMREGIEHLALSFARSGDDIDEVRKLTSNRMKIISKIECRDALEALDDIIERSDYLLIDRGDLSKEIPIERIPFTQKIIIAKAARHNVGVFVATNLLESMVERRGPTRAEVHDVVNTVVDGAAGLTLAAETAIGKHPIECVNMLNRLIHHAEHIAGPAAQPSPQPSRRQEALVRHLEDSDYLTEDASSSALVQPHGGRLVSRVAWPSTQSDNFESLPTVVITDKQHMEIEQIAIGTYSPIEGFLGEKDFRSVLSDTRLADGTIWSIPITLDVSYAVANGLSTGRDVGLVDRRGETVAVLHLEEQFEFDRETAIREFYGTADRRHPGVKMMRSMQPVLLGGKIDLLRRRRSVTKQYDLSPRQVRRLFAERGWTTVLGFHTRNVIHRGHEFLQLKSMASEFCDGLFVHPVVGKKKPGDFDAEFVIKGYELMMQKNYYPSNKVVFAAWPTFSRYAGPREALFTALCRKNFGCSHFIVGRDHTGVGGYYESDAAQKIFDQFDDIGIAPVRCDEVSYCRSSKSYFFSSERRSPDGNDRLRLSGTEARELFKQGKRPPTWYMRPEISKMIADAIRRGERVFEGRA